MHQFAGLHGPSNMNSRAQNEDRYNLYYNDRIMASIPVQSMDSLITKMTIIVFIGLLFLAGLTIYIMFPFFLTAWNDFFNFQ